MENNIELIEQYLEGTLAGEELKVFESKLKTDKSLAAQVHITKELSQAIKMDKTVQLKEKNLKLTLNSLGDKYFGDTKTEQLNQPREAIQKTISGNRNPFFKYAAAASIALLICAGLFFFNNSSLNPEQLADLHYEKTNYSALRGGNMDNTTDAKYLYRIAGIADTAFEANDYAVAQKNYKIVLENQSNETYKQKDINFEAVKWNMVLLDLNLGRVAAAKEELKKIQNSSKSKSYKGKASKLLEQL